MTTTTFLTRLRLQLQSSLSAVLDLWFFWRVGWVLLVLAGVHSSCVLEGLENEMGVAQGVKHRQTKKLSRLNCQL